MLYGVLFTVYHLIFNHLYCDVNGYLLFCTEKYKKKIESYTYSTYILTLEVCRWIDYIMNCYELLMLILD